MTNNKWTTLPDRSLIEKTMKALEANGIKASFVQSSTEAKEKVLNMIPQGAEVMTMTSVTADTIGITQEIMESGKYEAVKKKLATLDEKQASQKKKLGAGPDWAIGSVHAVTENGNVMIASNTGSQLPAYAYGAQHVIWVVGAQKIVADIQEGVKRIYDHVLPLEADRARKAYGVAGSNVSKLLIINKEVDPTRLHLIFVNEALGF